MLLVNLKDSNSTGAATLTMQHYILHTSACRPSSRQLLAKTHTPATVKTYRNPQTNPTFGGGSCKLTGAEAAAQQQAGPCKKHDSLLGRRHTTHTCASHTTARASVWLALASSTQASLHGELHDGCAGSKRNTETASSRKVRMQDGGHFHVVQCHPPLFFPSLHSIISSADTEQLQSAGTIPPSLQVGCSKCCAAAPSKLPCPLLSLSDTQCSLSHTISLPQEAPYTPPT